MTKHFPLKSELVAIFEVFEALEHPFMFVGGSTIPLLITDPTIQEFRPTQDVDVVVEILSRSKYEYFTEHLRAIGFNPDASMGAPLCRYLYRGLKVDVMPLDEMILGFGNHWYKDALLHIQHILIEQHQIPIMAAPYFLATKMFAFEIRGNSDFYGSRDLEDMLTILDGRVEIFQELSLTSESVKNYLREAFDKLLSNINFIYCVPAHLVQDSRNAMRSANLLRNLKAFAKKV
ncbi:MAG: hypothetical protein JNN12_00250 [Bacteroidetes Order II. Incertae sedis bacterium]|nr:hypothetical protein [Bacteroidetes Order II. bacterium]